MNICVLAWGSLLWERGNLQISSVFEPNGPTLPIEFSRISGIGNPPLRLTLVIDEASGSPCRIYAAQSSFDDLDRARENLREREGMDHVNGVGFVDARSGDVSSRAMERHPDAVETIRAWLEGTAFDAVIWTALASNFCKEQKVRFSEHAALAFLEELSPESQKEALKYFRSAPDLTQTRLRQAVAERWPGPA